MPRRVLGLISLALILAGCGMPLFKARAPLPPAPPPLPAGLVDAPLDP
jgi:hypothetical protein